MMKSRSKLLVLSCIYSSVIQAASAGQDTPSLSPITVMGSPIIEANSLDKFSANSNSITESQLRDLNAIDLPSALRHTPGVEISRYDQIGSYSGNQGGGVYVRGIGVSRPGSEIKTYVDGVPVYMGLWNHPLLDLLPVNGMQSITVYKGPQPQVNGNNFASVNLSTRRATEHGVHGGGSVSAGSFGTSVVKANIEGRQDNFDFMLAGGHGQSNGQRPNSNGTLDNATGRLALKVNDNWSVGASFISSNSTSGDPGRNTLPIFNTPGAMPLASNGVARDTAAMNMFTAFVSHQHGDSHGELRVYDTNGKNNLTNDAVWGTFNSNFKMSGLHWTETLTPWSGGTVVAGIEQDRISGNVFGPNTGGLQVAMPQFTVTSPHVAVSQAIPLNADWVLVPSAGVRTYSHSQYQSQTAPHAGVSLISEKVTLFANVSRGVNYPGLEGAGLQAAMPFMFLGTTWKQLKPETLDHKEVGIKFTPGEQTQIDLSLFQDDIKNRYVYDLAFGTTTFFNQGGYQTRGAELTIKQQLARDWKVFAGLTTLNSSLSTLPYAPKTAVTLGLNGQVEQFRIAFDMQHQSNMYGLNLDRNINAMSQVSTMPVAAFTVANVRLGYPMASLGKKGEVFVAAENLFNTTYAYNPGYPMPGRSMQVGLAASF